MNIEVNTKKIEDSLKLLDEYIKKYEDNLEDLFYEIEKVNSFWFGTDKDNFINFMNAEELNYELLISKLRGIENYFSMAVTKYNDFGNNVSSRLN